MFGIIEYHPLKAAMMSPFVFYERHQAVIERAALAEAFRGTGVTFQIIVEPAESLSA